MKKNDACFIDVVEFWRNNSMKPDWVYKDNWNGLRKLLVDLEKGKLAKRLEGALNAEKSTIRATLEDSEGTCSLLGQV